jgi:hypothetical protein
MDMFTTSGEKDNPVVVERFDFKLTEVAKILDRSQGWVRARFTKRPDTGITPGRHYRITRRSLLTFLNEKIIELDAESARLSKIRDELFPEMQSDGE